MTQSSVVQQKVKQEFRSTSPPSVSSSSNTTTTTNSKTTTKKRTRRSSFPSLPSVVESSFSESFGGLERRKEKSGAGGKKRRSRVRWTDSLHQRFLQAINTLGRRATPLLILQEMKEPSLSRFQVASHLQKFRRAFSMDSIPELPIPLDFRDQTDAIIRRQKKRMANSQDPRANEDEEDSSEDDDWEDEDEDLCPPKRSRSQPQAMMTASFPPQQPSRSVFWHLPEAHQASQGRVAFEERNTEEHSYQQIPTSWSAPDVQSEWGSDDSLLSESTVFLGHVQSSSSTPDPLLTSSSTSTLSYNPGFLDNGSPSSQNASPSLSYYNVPIHSIFQAQPQLLHPMLVSPSWGQTPAPQAQWPSIPLQLPQPQPLQLGTQTYFLPPAGTLDLLTRATAS